MYANLTPERYRLKAPLFTEGPFRARLGMTPLGAHPGTGRSARRPEGRPDLHCHSGPSVRPRVGDTATRA